MTTPLFLTMLLLDSPVDPLLYISPLFFNKILKVSFIVYLVVCFYTWLIPLYPMLYSLSASSSARFPAVTREGFDEDLPFRYFFLLFF